MRTLDQDLAEITTQPTVSVEVAARALGIGRGKAYELAKSGNLAPGLPVILIGHGRRVPAAPLRRALGIEEAQSAK
jgi:hypothetical protein